MKKEDWNLRIKLGKLSFYLMEIIGILLFFTTVVAIMKSRFCVALIALFFGSYISFKGYEYKEELDNEIMKNQEVKG